LELDLIRFDFEKNLIRKGEKYKEVGEEEKSFGTSKKGLASLNCTTQTYQT